jgi:hypothetical protein
MKIPSKRRSGIRVAAISKKGEFPRRALADRPPLEAHVAQRAIFAVFVRLPKNAETRLIRGFPVL